ncbi:helix-turn-helix domain-containing protein [Candidatus Venteria ishoeyi]|uniref:Uncharacterized protein n=1 Tax=Candidatus Venteria ishoeyi TaxID=1899563 RepID=A0A1H6F5A1_9GAMM|nr:helix-turn-helix transcriptional regulator [Candidatus Venteria ishoeyi]SEH05347.1 Uncharacterised protein [Candidatus Venteria ishoeyi]
MHYLVLKDFLNRNNLSQREAARRIGVTDRMMRYYASGEKQIPKSVEYALMYVADSVKLHVEIDGFNPFTLYIPHPTHIKIGTGYGTEEDIDDEDALPVNEFRQNIVAWGERDSTIKSNFPLNDLASGEIDAEFSIDAS